MAFGLFKKNNYADQIYYNAHIITQDPEYPEAEAVACKNGIIQAVGDNEYMDDFKGPDTEMVDLDGKYMYPGFINTKMPFVYQAFSELCLHVDTEDDLDYVLSQISDYVQENPDLDTYFIYGFDGKIFSDDDQEEISAKLDEISEETPIILLDEIGTVFRMNSIAVQILAETAEEECVEIITLSYLINLFLPFGYEESQVIAKEIMANSLDMGFTSILTLGTPNYMNDAFLNALLQIHTEEDLKQRYFFSYMQPWIITKGSVGYSLVDRQTSCVELGDQVSYQFLNVRLNPFAEWDRDGLLEMSKDAIERGFNVLIDAPNKEYAHLAFDVLNQIREDGLASPILVIGVPDDIEIDFEGEFVHFDQIIKTSYFEQENDIFVKAHSTQEALDKLTTEAADMLGMRKVLGSIEPDKYADFTVFNEDILDFSLQKFTHPHADMVIVGGEKTYDAQEEADNEMFDMLSQSQF